MLLRLGLFTVLGSGPVTVLGQVGPAVQWEVTLGGTGNDGSRTVRSTHDGGSIIAGNTTSEDGDVQAPLGIVDIWLTKLDSTGGLEWERAYGGSADDQGATVDTLPNGGFILGGQTNSQDGDVTGVHGVHWDCWLAELDASGELVWQKTLGGTEREQMSTVRPTMDGGYVVLATTESSDGDVSGYHGDKDLWVVKVDTAGEIIWQRALGGSNIDVAEGISQTLDGGFIVAGTIYSNDGDASFNHGSTDLWLVKLDMAGAVVWQRSYGGSSADHASSVIQTADGGYLAIGETFSNNGDVSGNHGDYDAWVIKVDSAGGLEWQKALGGSQEEVGKDVYQTEDDLAYVLTGSAESSDGDVSGGHGSSDGWFVKLDPFGSVLWQACYGGSASEILFSIAKAPAEGYLLCGSTYSSDGDVSSNHGLSDRWVLHVAGDISTGSSVDNEVHLMPISDPIYDRLEIRTLGPATPAHVTLTDMGGREVMIHDAMNGACSLNVAHLRPGCFILTVIANGGRTCRTLVKQ
jgi:hypothetical protein